MKVSSLNIMEHFKEARGMMPKIKGKAIELKENVNWARKISANLLWLAMFIWPFVSKYFITPLVFHPQRLGGVPWSPPMGITLSLTETVITYLGIFIAFVYSATVYSLDFCGQRNLELNSKRSIWAIGGYIFARLISDPLSMLVAPFVNIVPYGGELTGHLVRSYIGFYFGRMGLQSVVEELC